MANMKLVLPGSVNCQILPESESRQAAIRQEVAFVTPLTALLPLLLTIGLLRSTPLREQMLECFWNIGGCTGLARKDWGHIKILVDDFSVTHALQARALQSDVNIALVVYSHFPYAWFLELPGPFGEDGMPRLGRGWGT